MRSNAIPFEVPWLATMHEGKLHLNDKAGYDQWIGSAFGDGERAMVIVVPLVADATKWHAAVYRYYFSTVLPIAAEDLGEANLEDAHDTLAKMFLPSKPVKKKRGGIRAQRASTAMAAMPCDILCEYVDRVVVWLTTERRLVVPLADRQWKWKRDRKAAAA